MNVRMRVRWTALAGAVVVSGGCADVATGVSPAPAPSVARVDASPLVVVDGVPYDLEKGPGLLAKLEPDAIASVEILKGPAATALYGSRAAEGVILITTRR